MTPYDQTMLCVRGLFVCITIGFAIGVAGVLLWLSIVTWELETSCNVESVVHNDTFAFQKTNCIFVDRCNYDTCRYDDKVVMDGVTRDNIPCCESTSHGKSRGYNRCLLRRFNRTITRVTFYSSSRNLQTFEIVTTDFPDIPPQVNQSWSCHYEHYLSMDNEILASGKASNVTWIAVVSSVSGFFFILCCLCFLCNRK